MGNAKAILRRRGNLKTSKTERSLAEAAGFGVFTGPTPVEKGAKITPPQDLWWTGPTRHRLPAFCHRPRCYVLGRINNQVAGWLPHRTGCRAEKKDAYPFPANKMEKAWFRLKLGNALLEWADLLYRTDKPDSIHRARDSTRACSTFTAKTPPSRLPGVHLGLNILPFFTGKLVQNPQLTAQINRAHVGFDQINAGLNYYGFPKDYVPPVRYRVLREAALSFAASAKSTQNDYLNYMAKVRASNAGRNDRPQHGREGQLRHSNCQRAGSDCAVQRWRSQKAGGSCQSANRSQKKEIKDSESFFSQLGDFYSGMKDAAKGLGRKRHGQHEWRRRSGWRLG